jgi:hypothetical protein
VSHTPIKRPADYRATRLENIDTAKVLPQPKRYRRQYDPRLPASPKLRFVIPIRIEHITHLYRSPSFFLTNSPGRFPCRVAEQWLLLTKAAPISFGWAGAERGSSAEQL